MALPKYCHCCYVVFQNHTECALQIPHFTASTLIRCSNTHFMNMVFERAVTSKETNEGLNFGLLCSISEFTLTGKGVMSLLAYLRPRAQSSVERFPPILRHQPASFLL